MTHYTRSDLEMADRHIAQGARLVVQQEKLVARLRLHALPAEDAEGLLALFNAIMSEHHTHRAAIATALGDRG